jgi:hypothetical protein
MNWLAFISAMTSALAWPAAIAAIALIFRGQIIALLQDIRKLRVGDVELQLGDEVEKIREEVKEVEEDPDFEDVPVDPKLVNLADSHPHLAVLEGWKRLERVILDFTTKRLAVDRTRPIQYHLQVLATSGQLPSRMMKTIEDIREVRNRAAHEIDIHVSKGTAYILLDTMADLEAYLTKRTERQ